ncbi:MAG: transcriptional regulator [Fluviicola sp.]|nr:MAG: transcriptional regulator [Fluviicola sp.]
MSEIGNRIFKAIADPTRREIFHLLVIGSALSISQISNSFDISRQGVTKHIKVLEEANMVEFKTQGREKFIFAKPEALKEVKDWLAFYDKFWDDKLDSLGRYLDETT